MMLGLDRIGTVGLQVPLAIAVIGATSREFLRLAGRNDRLRTLELHTNCSSLLPRLSTTAREYLPPLGPEWLRGRSTTTLRETQRQYVHLLPRCLPPCHGGAHGEAPRGSTLRPNPTCRQPGPRSSERRRRRKRETRDRVLRVCVNYG